MNCPFYFSSSSIVHNGNIILTNYTSEGFSVCLVFRHLGQDQCQSFGSPLQRSLSSRQLVGWTSRECLRFPELRAAWRPGPSRAPSCWPSSDSAAGARGCDLNGPSLAPDRTVIDKRERWGREDEMASLNIQILSDSLNAL